MATPFPVDLAESAAWGWEETPVYNKVETAMSSGSTKQRRRFAKQKYRYRVSTYLTSSQRTSFLTFWESGIKSGTMEFSWKDPHTAVTVNYRMIGMYQMSHLEGDYQNAVYSLSMEIEKQ